MPGPGSESAAEQANCTNREASADNALALMIDALALLDRDGGADIAGAHLDLAIHRLREWLDRNRA